MESNSQNTQSIKKLIELIDEQIVFLPEFQRDFVWELPQTYALFDSLIKDIFIGAIIYGIPSFDIAVRALDDRKKVKGKRRQSLVVKNISESEINKLKQLNKGVKLILDGQQRVTSIYRALKGVDDVWIIAKNDDELEDVVFDDDKTPLEDIVYEVCGEEDADRLSIKLSDIWDIDKGDLDDDEIKNSYFMKSSYYLTNMDDIDEKREFKRYKKLYKRILQILSSEKLLNFYLLDMNLDKFVTFFERSNTKGVQLNFIDILTAKLYTGDFKLKDKIYEFEAENTNCQLKPEIIVRLIAYLKSSPKEINRNYILTSLNADDFKSQWDELCLLYKKAVDFLFENHFIISQDWMPYENMIIPIIVFLREIGGDFHKMTHEQHQFITYWYWSSILSLRYSGSSNERIIEDANNMIHIAKGRKISSNQFFNRLNKLQITSPEDIFSFDKKANAVYKGILNLINYNSKGFTDWNNTGKLSLNSNLEDHHIFPKAYIKAIDSEQLYDKVDCVANRTLVPKLLNIKINAQAPSLYLKEIELKNVQISECLKSHLIVPDLMTGLFDNEFEMFLTLRAEEIFRIISETLIDKQDQIKQMFFEEISYEDVTNIPIFAKYNKNIAEATFNPSTQKVFYRGQLYDSPSAAAVAVLQEFNSTRTTENGWTFWKFTTHNGEVLRLKEFRKDKKL